MEQLKNKMNDKAERYLLSIDDASRVLGIHSDAVRTLVDMRLLPCSKISPRFGPQFRAEDVRFLLSK